MANLEGWAQKFIGPLVEQTWPCEEHKILIEAITEQESLAKWALKTAIMMDRTSTMEQVIDDQTPRLLFNGKLSEGLAVDLAYISMMDLRSDLTFGVVIPFVGGATNLKFSKDPTAFQVVMQFNHLAIRVCRFHGARKFYRSVEGRIRVPVRVYPQAVSPLKADFHFDDCEEFTHCLVVMP